MNVRERAKNVFNTLSYDKILVQSKLKASADDYLNVAQVVHFFFVENVVGKVENVGYQHFSFFHNVLKKHLSQGC